MKINFRKIKNLFTRGYDAVQPSRLFSSWFTYSQTKDDELKYALVDLRNKARDLCNNDDYAKRYINLMRQNVVGLGFKLQVKASEYVNGKLTKDTAANQVIEDAFALWSRAENCTPSGNITLRKVEDLAVQHWTRDGEAFIRIIENSNFGEFNFNIQVLDPDFIDDSFNGTNTATGNDIIMGVEVDEWRRPVAYYYDRKKQTRMPANEIIHIYDPERAVQTRGVTDFAPVIKTLKRLNEYDKAALTNAEIAAKKMGFFVNTGTQESKFTGGKADPFSMKIEAGSFTQLPANLDFKMFDSKFPDGNHDVFVKSHIRRCASGLNVSYCSLSSDVSSVNFSSIRASLLDEREYYKTRQQTFIEVFLIPVFERWLKWSLATGKILLPNGSPLPVAKFQKFNKPTFIGRRWQWVDPQADTQANLLAIAGGLKTRADVIAEQGGDIEEVFSQLEEENTLAQTHNLILTTSINQPSPGTVTPDSKNNADGNKQSVNTVAFVAPILSH